MKQIIIALTIVFMLSCEKECYEERDTLPQVDALNLLPNGTYTVDEAFSKDNITWNLNDSTATIKYSDNDTTYEFIYSIKITGNEITNQKKF